MRTAKTLIRLGGCPGWSESSLGAQIILLVLSWGGSVVENNMVPTVEKQSPYRDKATTQCVWLKFSQNVCNCHLFHFSYHTTATFKHMNGFSCHTTATWTNEQTNARTHARTSKRKHLSLYRKGFGHDVSVVSRKPEVHLISQWIKNSPYGIMLMLRLFSLLLYINKTASQLILS